MSFLTNVKACYNSISYLEETLVPVLGVQQHVVRLDDSEPADDSEQSQDGAAETVETDIGWDGLLLVQDDVLHLLVTPFFRFNLERLGFLQGLIPVAGEAKGKATLLCSIFFDTRERNNFGHFDVATERWCC